MDNKERLYVRAVNLIADIQKRTTNWSRTAELIEQVKFDELKLAGLDPHTCRSSGAVRNYCFNPYTASLLENVGTYALPFAIIGAVNRG